MRNTNYLNLNPITKFFDACMTNTVNMAGNYMTSKAKNYFGKEFLFAADSTDSSVLNEIIVKFIKKYDKNFELHTQKANSDIPRLVNVQFMVPLHKTNGIPDTFMYVASGMKMGNLEGRFLSSSRVSADDTYIYIGGKKMKKYVKELETLVHSVYCNNDLGLFTIDSRDVGLTNRDGSISESMDVTWQKLATRDLSTLFFSSGEIEKITKHIDRFNDNEDFYTKKQLIYKTGILLYGKPGTGKSSLVKALASTYNRSIINVNVSHLINIDLNKLTQSINIDDERRYIVLFEDIDTLFLNRDAANADKQDRNVINKLLQFLDSNTSPTNVIFIATTNHKEQLDEALLRDGRFDLKVEVNELDQSGVYKFASSFGLSEYQANEVIDEFKYDNDGKMPESFNQSALQTRLLNKIDNKKRDIEIVDSSELIKEKWEKEQDENNAKKILDEYDY